LWILGNRRFPGECAWFWSLTFSTAGRSPITFDQLSRLDIPVRGLDCKGCALGTAKAINHLDGVYFVTVDFKAGVVSTRIDPAMTNHAALVEALKKANVTVNEP